ncbi:similar to Saccharomyces cerevisiae YOR273C TPO4 Polyamine transport protein, recognizes spermine, putrescine, and spermidine [Maudiozyma saulgeensis]|uniref:Similar to Saccharomyces cerevisiae YOR273C TPO4 Polyamine transport protein, recognizes spermine, putrescine, and spermidine n=1 Tax=Maudiozyma saulgeensis TaxID=1789683 RepID=A0A1X7R5M3_9SACH|nr:similar to Saccharomyces cerevisiae YOR273C TPO4 Polyamine transport protein, recognizes spermine, putrescine, and spermidine [Kazachstania saulgeensis]
MSAVNENGIEVSPISGTLNRIPSDHGDSTSDNTMSKMDTDIINDGHNSISETSTADSSISNQSSASTSISNEVSDNNKNNNEEEEIDPKDLEWDGPSDMDNPHNWPLWKKWTATMTAAMLCLVVTMGSSLYVASVPEFEVRYHISQTLGLAGLTFYLLGLSTVIGAPLSEVFGRKIIYLTSLPLSCLFTMGVGLSNGHMRIILPCRFFSGVFASPALSIASGTIMDIFDVDEVSTAMTFFCVAPFMGPVMSPIISGFAVESQGWRWSQWIQLFAAGLIFPFIVIMPETHKGVILRTRAKKRNMKLKVFSKEDQKQFLKITMTITVLRPLKMLVVEPIVLVFSIYIAFIFAVLFAFFEAYPVIYRGVYHMDLGISGLPFLGIGIGLWIGCIFYLYIDRKYLFPKAPEGTPELENPTSLRTTPYRGHRDPETGKLKPVCPEDFLLACKIGSLALPIALFWQAWTARADVHWMAPIAAGVPFGFGLILIFFSCIMYFSASYPPLCVASCMAANNMLRYVTSSVFPLFTVQMYEKMQIKWASTLFALICIVMLPIPWIFERWGEKLRNKSVFGYAAMLREAEMAQGESGDNVTGDLDLTKLATLQTMETELSRTDSHSGYYDAHQAPLKIDRTLSRKSKYSQLVNGTRLDEQDLHDEDKQDIDPTVDRVRPESIYANVNQDQDNENSQDAQEELSSRIV